HIADSPASQRELRRASRDARCRRRCLPVRRPYYAGRVSLPVVLIADKLAESTVAALGGELEVRWVDGPDRAKLLAAVPEADALLVRSATTVDAEGLDAAPRLKIVARAGV